MTGQRSPDVDGHRFTAMATDARRGQLADLERRHRRRARCEDRIRGAKDTGLRPLPRRGSAQNQVGCEIAALACELFAWAQMLAQPGPARRRKSPASRYLRPARQTPTWAKLVRMLGSGDDGERVAQLGR